LSLPLKKALHAVDPIQRLKILHRRLEFLHESLEDDLEFHREMTEIFNSLRDLHTN